MVTNVTSFGRSGLSDWLVQRVSAVIIAAYTLFLLGYILINPNLEYEQWATLFQQAWVRIFSLIALLSLAAHAWVGIWTIATDYIQPTSIRFLFLLGCIAALFLYVVWGIAIFWRL